MFSIDDLVKIKKFLPIIYVTGEANQVAKLIILFPRIQEKYNNLKLILVVSDIHKEIFDYPFTMSYTTFKEYNHCFAKEYMIQENINGDTVDDFCNENDVDFFVSKANPHNNTAYYIGKEDNQSIKRIAERTFRIRPIYIKNLDSVVNSNSIIIGFDSPELVAAAYLGKKIILFGTEKRTISFRKMFPDTVLVNYHL